MFGMTSKSILCSQLCVHSDDSEQLIRKRDLIAHVAWQGTKRNILHSIVRQDIICWFDDDDFYGQAYVSNMVAKLTAGALFTSTITQVAFFPGREPAFRCDNPPAKDFHPMLGNTFGYWRYGSARFCLCTVLTFTSCVFRSGQFCGLLCGAPWHELRKWHELRAEVCARIRTRPNHTPVVV